ncbi:hypothetical protein N665_0366s0020 [Sinapis alba]|nr:hypothetical protein N665_0366s0020 [Sinapis alba]
MYRVQRELPIGEWRMIENFKISAAGGQYRPTRFQYKMTIIGDTMITHTDYRNDNHILSLARYEEIGTEKLKTYFLIDILGQVVDLGQVISVQVKGEERKKVQFRLRETSGNEVAYCLWGQYAEQMESHIAKSKDQTIICLIRFAKISEFRVLMLNPTMEEAIDFKQQYKLHVLVKDDTGSSELMLLDTVATIIIGDKAVDIWDGSYAEVSEVWYGDHIHRIKSLSEPVSLIETSSSTMSTSEVHLIDHNKESSSENVSTPFSKRKEANNHLKCMNSSTKKLCAKSIKMEKTKED